MVQYGHEYRYGDEIMDYIIIAILVVIVLILLSSISDLQNKIRKMNTVLEKISDQVGVPEDPVNNDLRILISEGKKIEAIRKCRESTGLGLKEAKDYIDDLERKIVSKP
jgi:ribosomal protein L7/L12